MTTDEEISPLVKRVLAEDYGVKQGYDAIAYIGVSLASLAKLEKLAREDVLKAHEDHDFCKRENCAACYLLDEKEKEIQALKEALEVSVADYNSMKKQKEKAEAELNTVRNVAIKQLILDKKNLENALREIAESYPANPGHPSLECGNCVDFIEIAKKALQEKA